LLLLHSLLGGSACEDFGGSCNEVARCLALDAGALAVFKPSVGRPARSHSLHLEIAPEDDNYALRWSLLKRHFTKSLGKEMALPSGNRKGERRVWQRRFWEHAIRDERDLENHFVYIRGNPVRHGYAKTIEDWPHSSFHERGGGL
jgi:hypothetical protein